MCEQTKGIVDRHDVYIYTNKCALSAYINTDNAHIWKYLRAINSPARSDPKTDNLSISSFDNQV